MSATNLITQHKGSLDKLVLTLIFAVLSASTIIWTTKDRTPPPWDPSDHLRQAYDYYRPLSHLDFGGFLQDVFVNEHFYAPAVHLLTAVMFLLFGASRLTGIFVNLISLAALLGSVYWMAKTLYGTEDAEGEHLSVVGILAGLVAACSHFSAWLMHDAFLDFPLEAIVSVSFALLIRAGDFRSRRKVLAFAVAAGLGMLVKQTFAFFFVLPAAYLTVKILRSRDRQAIVNLLLCGVVIAAIAAVWYGPHLHDVIAIYQENRRAAIDENEAPLFTFDSSFYYIHELISSQLQLPFATLLVIGLIYSFVRRRKQGTLLCLWLASGLGMFALVANKDIRYTVPIVPAAAVLSVCWLAGIRSPRLKLALGAPIALWAFVSFFNAQWPSGPGGIHIDMPRYRWMVFERNYFGFDHRPLGDDWSVPQVVQTVVAQPPAAADRAQILGVVVNLPYLSPSGVALQSRLMQPARGGPPLVDVLWLVSDSATDVIDRCDYLLVRTGLEQADWSSRIERTMQALIQSQPERFTRVASFPIPLKGAESVIYRCNHSSQQPSSGDNR